MDDEKPTKSRGAVPSFYGTHWQKREIERWQDAGWLFLQWLELPLVVAVLENATGDIMFIDGNGWAWKGANFSKAEPVPLEQYPPLGFDEWMT